MSIYTVNGNPVKYGNKWLATDGGTPSGELPPYDSSDAGKALVVNNEGDNVEWQTVGSSITVDQHYDSTSTNAQSGTAVAEAISTKQDTISDLSTIRSGAEAGATAVQPSDLATVATTGDYNDLVNLPTIPSAVTVDQHYDATSVNPQSGTAVAEALQTVPDELPSITGNAGKVLKVNSGATGVEWATESAGATYTAGDGIAIDGNHKISADVDGTTIGIDSTTKKIKLLSTIPTVDQTYNASSTNAQSGTAVASAVSNAVSGLDEVPAVTSSDNGKVLKATYSGGAGSYAWDTDNDTTYTAGTMIGISNQNAISVSTTAGITDIQMVNALPANPVATVLYLIPAT